MEYSVVLTCSSGVSALLADEVRNLGLSVSEVGTATVTTSACLRDLYRLNLHLRTAHRVLVLLKSFRCTHPDALYKRALGIPWEDWIDPRTPFRVHNAVNTPCIRDTRYPNLKVKDAVVDRLRNKTGRRPDSGSREEGAAIFLHWKDHEASLYLDFSGTPLSRRGYRVKGGTAPMQESLAAAVILASKWDGTTPIVNPMCGSGTLAIEAAWIAKRQAPGVLRDHFACLSLRNVEHALWRDVWEEARKQERSANDLPPVLASDCDWNAVATTKENAHQAEVLDQIETTTCDFRDQKLPASPGWILLNPEYGVRMGNEDDLKPHYRDIGDWLKTACGGWNAALFTGSLPLSRQVGLKPYARMPMFNGKLESRLLLFELFAGHWRDQKK